MVSRRPSWSRPLGVAAALILTIAVLATLATAHRARLATEAASTPLPAQLLRNLPATEREPLSARMDRYARLIPPQQHWYAANGARTACGVSGGPLALLEVLGESNLEASRPKVSVHWRDWYTVARVQLEVLEDASPPRRVEFYPTRLACEAATASHRRTADARR